MREVPEMAFLKRNQVLAVSAILLSACTGAPVDPINVEPYRTVPNISGVWTFEADLIENLPSPADGIVCDASGYQLVIDQNEGATTFTGTYSGGKLTCVLQGDTLLNRSASGTIVNGIVGHVGIFTAFAPVEFDFDTRDAHQTGSVRSDTSMTGSASWRIDFADRIFGSISLSGEWMAVR